MSASPPLSPPPSGRSDPGSGRADRRQALLACPAAERALEALAFGNASFLPLPVELLLVPMVSARPRLAARLTALAALASCVGIVYGYALGHFAGEALPAVLASLGQGERLDQALRLLHAHGAELVLVAALAPVPFVLLTVAAGLSGYGFVAFLPLALAGRCVRLALVGAAVAGIAPHLRRDAARGTRGAGRALFVALALGTSLAVLAWGR